MCRTDPVSHHQYSGAKGHTPTIESELVPFPYPPPRTPMAGIFAAHGLRTAPAQPLYRSCSSRGYGSGHSSPLLRTMSKPRRRGKRGCNPALALPVPREEREREEGKKQKEEEGVEEMESYSVLTATRSEYNEIVVLDTPKSRVLLLDSTHNVHSILYKDRKLTGSYWDDFATLPAIIPKGPIAILGLGAGTAAHIMLDIWPSLHLEGWEIDGILVDKAREYFGLFDLENQTYAGGFLSVNIGDALSSAMNIQGGFAGIVVDLFSGGKVLPQLQQVTTWSELERSLMPNGRIMVNCGGAHSETSHTDDGLLDPNFLIGGSWVQNSTIKTLNRIFPKMLSWRRLDEKYCENYLALTGPVPDFDSWSAADPSKLSSIVKQWKPCEDV